MSIRENICSNIVTTLLTIPNIKLVTREPFKFEELSNAQYPAIYVQTAGERRDDITIGAASTRRQSVLTVQVFGFVKSTAIDSARNSLVELIEEGLDADRTRGGYALDTQVVEVQTDEGSLDPIGGVVLTVSVLYTFNRGNA